jgi:hypothetical protein
MKSNLTFSDGRPITCYHHRKQICREKAGLPPCPAGFSEVMQQTWRQALLPMNSPRFRAMQAAVGGTIGFGIGSYYENPKIGTALGIYLGWLWSWGA